MPKKSNTSRAQKKRWKAHRIAQSMTKLTAIPPTSSGNPSESPFSLDLTQNGAEIDLIIESQSSSVFDSSTLTMDSDFDSSQTLTTSSVCDSSSQTLISSFLDPSSQTLMSSVLDPSSQTLMSSVYDSSSQTVMSSVFDSSQTLINSVFDSSQTLINSVLDSSQTVTLNSVLDSSPTLTLNSVLGSSQTLTINSVLDSSQTLTNDKLQSENDRSLPTPPPSFSNHPPEPYWLPIDINYETEEDDLDPLEMHLYAQNEVADSSDEEQLNQELVKHIFYPVFTQKSPPESTLSLGKRKTKTGVLLKGYKKPRFQPGSAKGKPALESKHPLSQFTFGLHVLPMYRFFITLNSDRKGCIYLITPWVIVVYNHLRLVIFFHHPCPYLASW
ncbi:uncharacterized protein MELLADRAFT_89336 [Melampsora larici-populina 98AG31]|uniref:Uncharacterized protein n=1 Tax=Melampsora larici-populina (strain 98AG31 / pathotype 3-4-7) TaxID=747676 RepID=F4R5S7_MELLP|nr:uncharacterized protein MELLADRAFT_89336 [Melampsora larici-populina 98AG31]EGG12092.1 hypothetical protein MELLADRAFT_89336 [Melampsora larici-populina 98AG31]